MLADKRVHTVLPTHDVDRLSAFYRDVVGIPVRSERPGAVLFETTAGSVLVVSRTGALSTGSHTQRGFTVTDIEAEVRDLRVRGVETETYDIPGMPTVSLRCRPAGRPGSRIPTNNLIALFQFDDPT
jgi:predicted enzyme related to lactoylglutathione lyase